MELIDKDVIVSEIERRKEEYEEYYQKYGCPYDSVVRDEMEKILSFIDTLEVKKVDLDTVMEEEYDKYRCYNSNGSMLVTLNKLQFNSIAKHFFELGLETHKDLTV